MRHTHIALVTLFLAGTFGSRGFAQTLRPGEDNGVTPWQAEDHGPFFSSSLLTNKPVKNATDKGISIRLGADHRAAVCFDTDLLRVSAGWFGGFIRIPWGRDVARHPDPDGKVEFGCDREPGWSVGEDFSDPRPDHFGPLPKERGHYRGLYLNGERVILSYSVNGVGILESFDLEQSAGLHAYARTVEVGPSDKPLSAIVCEQAKPREVNAGSNRIVALENAGDVVAAALLEQQPGVELKIAGPRILLHFAPHAQPILAKVLIWDGTTAQLPGFAAMAKSSSEPAVKLSDLTHGGKPRWTPALVTQGQLGTGAGAYVVDTLTEPADNPWKSYLRFSGFDFFSNGDAAVCSVSGDVWIVSGINDTLDRLSWRRFATGLFQPLGLKIVNDQIYVLGRDQITRLHDLTGSGEADFYENFNNGGKVFHNGPDYCCGLETDKQGNFYYTKCFNPSDQGGTVLKVSADGEKIEVFATGLRNSNGMAMSPDGTLCLSDNEGEWVPSSRIDFVTPGKFLGYAPMAHGAHPTGPGWPIWIPHSIDNSSGGQAWVTSDRWGPLEGGLVHTSYGMSSLYLVMPEVVNDRLQGATYRFSLKFNSGIMRARFNPKDGQLYVCGLRGWQTTGLRSAAFQRVRYTGRKAYLPRAIHNETNGIRLTFTQPLDPKTAEDVESWGISQWNYRWTKSYGSAEWSVKDPAKTGHDAVELKSARLSPDRKTVFLEIPTIQPVMQMEIQYTLDAADGTPMNQEIYNTINALPNAGK